MDVQVDVRDDLDCGIDAARRAQGWLDQWKSCEEGVPSETRIVLAARALSEVTTALVRLGAVRDAMAGTVDMWYPVELTAEIETLSETIADRYIQRIGAISFDQAVADTVTSTAHVFTVDQLTAVIMRARELCSEHGLLTVGPDENGQKSIPPTGGTMHTRAHDAHTAATLYSHHKN